ncbi:hypothetical protein SDC9_170194 [bioreactor metagenome]|uniref:Uncharacterized protein n=1 Tax=bioreactor metagenome TaxID=1076179 RepID=A0A645G9V8_9ZZZZ|nr:hypothetical protein [Proteiniphilum sp.]MEA4919233.1 hypothetical protein [Proteiniphilum sp.]
MNDSIQVIGEQREKRDQRIRHKIRIFYTCLLPDNGLYFIRLLRDLDIFLRMEEDKTNDLTPERVVQILKKKGTEVNLEEAKTILAFVKKIASIAVNQYLRGKF